MKVALKRMCIRDGGGIAGLRCSFCKTRLRLGVKEETKVRYCWRCNWLEKLKEQSAVKTIDLALEDETEKTIQQIQEDYKLKTKSDVIFYSVWLLDYFLKQKVEGREVWVTDKIKDEEQVKLIQQIALSDKKTYVPDKGWILNLPNRNE